MTVATLPPQNHIAYLRTLVSRIRYSGHKPSHQEMAHAEDSLLALEEALAGPREEATP